MTRKNTCSLLVLLISVVLTSVLGTLETNRSTRKILTGRYRNGRTSVVQEPVSFTPETTMNRGMNAVMSGITSAITMVLNKTPPLVKLTPVRVHLITE